MKKQKCFFLITSTKITNKIDEQTKMCYLKMDIKEGLSYAFSNRFSI